jgi:hypothetical protein
MYGRGFLSKNSLHDCGNIRSVYDELDRLIVPMTDHQQLSVPRKRFSIVNSNPVDVIQIR